MISGQNKLCPTSLKSTPNDFLTLFNEFLTKINPRNLLQIARIEKSILSVLEHDFCQPLDRVRMDKNRNSQILFQIYIDTLSRA